MRSPIEVADEIDKIDKHWPEPPAREKYRSGKAWARDMDRWVWARATRRALAWVNEEVQNLQP